MKMSLIQYLACPECGEKLYLDGCEKRGDDIWKGVLRCHGHIHLYHIVDGVPDFVPSDIGASQLQVGESYSQKWKLAPDYGFTAITESFQREWYLQKFGWRTLGNLAAFLRTKKYILDAGCGLGRDLKLYAEKTKGQVFGVDISDSTKLAYEKLQGMENVHIIKADMMHLPFAEGFFDFIVSDQALHHTPDTRAAFSNLARYLRRRGQIAAYVYKKKDATREFADDLIRRYTTEMSYADCMIFAHACATFGMEISKLNIELQREIYWGVFKCFWNEEYESKINAMINLDWYHPKYAWRHTPEEVRGWFNEVRLKELSFDVCPSGISVRGYKQ